MYFADFIHSGLIIKCNVGYRSLLQQGMSEAVFMMISDINSKESFPYHLKNNKT